MGSNPTTRFRLSSFTPRFLGHFPAHRNLRVHRHFWTSGPFYGEKCGDNLVTLLGECTFADTPEGKDGWVIKGGTAGYVYPHANDVSRRCVQAS